MITHCMGFYKFSKEYALSCTFNELWQLYIDSLTYPYNCFFESEYEIEESKDGGVSMSNWS